MQFDDQDIVGPDIWILYKDVAGSDIRNMLMLLRAFQLGYLPMRELKAAMAASRPLETARFWELNAKVENRLPKFKKMSLGVEDADQPV